MSDPRPSDDGRRGDPAVARVPCPTCGRRTVWRENPQWPFCSLTCRLIDLGLWLDGRYRIDADDDRLRGPSNSE